MFNSARTTVAFSNVGHAYTHLFMLLYPTVVLTLEKEFHRSYGELLALATPGFLLMGAGALPAGWLGDRWSGRGMMAIFFFGMGGAAVFTGLADSLFMMAIMPLPLQRSPPGGQRMIPRSGHGSILLVLDRTAIPAHARLRLRS